jgi:hypothetical protein
MRTRDWLLNLIPAVLLFPLLWAKIPTSYQPMRESTQYFQSQALLRYGFEAFTFTTPFETEAGLEL